MPPQPLKDNGWSELDFRRPSRHRRDGNDGSLSPTAIAILVAVLLFPWYQWWVHAQLDKRAMAKALAEMNAQAQRELAAAREQQVDAARRAQAQSLESRLSTVRIAGTGTASGIRLVIVDFGASNLAEARERVCSLAERQFRESLSGEALRVQASQGRRPARELGVVRCP